MNKSKLNVSGSEALTTNADGKSERELKRKYDLEVVDDYNQQDDMLLLEDTDTSSIAFLWLVIFSLLMFTFPFVTFYGVRSWLRESFDVTDFYVNCWSVLSSVLVVNAIICLYVFKAISEEDKRGPVTEREDTKND